MPLSIPAVVGLLAAGLVSTCTGAAAARSYPDRAGDVAGGAGPDIVSVNVSNTKTAITFRVRFAAAPPLRASVPRRWVDMLLIGVDVPPLGPRPVVPGGEWRGMNYAVGTHGPAKTGQLVPVGAKPPARPVRFAVVTRGATVSFSVPRRALGDPEWFAFTVAAAREADDDGGVDVAPESGTFHYELTR